jgi:hypothetical protein
MLEDVALYVALDERLDERGGALGSRIPPCASVP